MGGFLDDNYDNSGNKYLSSSDRVARGRYYREILKCLFDHKERKSVG